MGVTCSLTVWEIYKKKGLEEDTIYKWLKKQILMDDNSREENKWNPILETNILRNDRKFV